MADKIFENNQVSIVGECLGVQIQPRGLRRGLLYGGRGSEPPEQLSGLYSVDGFPSD